MEKYQHPCIHLQSISFISETQYVFVVSSEECPSLSADGAVGTEEGLAFCAPSFEQSSGFSTVITCANIDGTYHAVYGDAVAGGGLDCGNGVSVIYPLISIDSDLPGDCIIDSFIRNGSSDDCVGQA